MNSNNRRIHAKASLNTCLKQDTFFFSRKAEVRDLGQRERSPVVPKLNAET